MLSCDRSELPRQCVGVNDQGTEALWSKGRKYRLSRLSKLQAGRGNTRAMSRDRRQARREIMGQPLSGFGGNPYKLLPPAQSLCHIGSELSGRQKARYRKQLLGAGVITRF